ncbi:hypothetical protein BST31_04150 [Mycobacterium marseillense]|nr:hypothetical protein BST31_04150 [Mycobacterium marseillense]
MAKDLRHSASRRSRNLRRLAGPTDNIDNDKTIECPGRRRKALHCPAFRQYGRELRMRRGLFVTGSAERALQ